MKRRDVKRRREVKKLIDNAGKAGIRQFFRDSLPKCEETGGPARLVSMHDPAIGPPRIYCGNWNAT
jgi:hypothetical protein